MSTTFNDVPALCEEILKKVVLLEHKVESIVRTQTEQETTQKNDEETLLTLDETAEFLGLAKSTSTVRYADVSFPTANEAIVYTFPKRN